jgi:hypothetical protein
MTEIKAYTEVTALKRKQKRVINLSQEIIKPALLTKAELEWLLGNIHVSKAYERRMRFSIRNKIQTLREFELPLLIDKGFISNNIAVTANCNAVTTDCNVKKPDSSSFLQNKEALAGIRSRDLCLTKATLTASLITMKLFHWRPRLQIPAKAVLHPPACPLPTFPIIHFG